MANSIAELIANALIPSAQAMETFDYNDPRLVAHSTTPVRHLTPRGAKPLQSKPPIISEMEAYLRGPPAPLGSSLEVSSQRAARSSMSHPDYEVSGRARDAALQRMATNAKAAASGLVAGAAFFPFELPSFAQDVAQAIYKVPGAALRNGWRGALAELMTQTPNYPSALDYPLSKGFNRLIGYDPEVAAEIAPESMLLDLGAFFAGPAALRGAGSATRKALDMARRARNSLAPQVIQAPRTLLPVPTRAPGDINTFQMTREWTPEGWIWVQKPGK